MGLAVPVVGVTSILVTGCVGREVAPSTWLVSPAPRVNASFLQGKNADFWRIESSAGHTMILWWRISNEPRKTVSVWMDKGPIWITANSKMIVKWILHPPKKKKKKIQLWILKLSKRRANVMYRPHAHLTEVCHFCCHVNYFLEVFPKKPMVRILQTLQFNAILACIGILVSLKHQILE